MLVLFETPAGYALFKVVDKGKLQLQSEESIDLSKEFATPEKAAKIVKLKAFSKFEDTTKALAAASSICEGKLDKSLKKFLKQQILGDSGEENGETVAEAKTKLAVGDIKLGNAIKEKLGISCIYSEAVMELMRGIRSQLDSLLAGSVGTESDREAMRLGLSHSLCRYKLKFSPDKVDTMVIQAIALLDELDKELNTYAMRVREWYGWHYPELAKLINETILYAKVVLKMGVRSNASKTDLSDILPEAVEKSVKENAEVSAGTDISEEDILNIKDLCEQVISISEYRTNLFEYLKNRMNAIAPNLTCMVGELVGARLIAHAGSLLSLAKQPASTVQILGAEKALFRALKTKHDTPKYGLIYHASLVGQAPPKLRGKISRVLAAKTALSIRTDALDDTDGITVGLKHRQQVEDRLRFLETGVVQKASGKGAKKLSETSHTKAEAVPSYNPAADVALSTASTEKEKKKKKKDQVKEEVKEVVEETETAATPEVVEDESSQKKKKKEKRRKEEEATSSSADAEAANGTATAAAEEEVVKEKAKKEKKEKKQKVEEPVPPAPVEEVQEKPKKSKKAKTASQE